MNVFCCSLMSRALLVACVAVLRAHFKQIESAVEPDLSDFYVRAACFLPGAIHVEYGRYRQAGAAVWPHRPPSSNSSAEWAQWQMSSGLVAACVRLWHAAAFGVVRPDASPVVLGGHFSAEFVRVEYDRSCGQVVLP